MTEAQLAEHYIQTITESVKQFRDNGGLTGATPLPRLALHFSSEVTKPLPAMYAPSFCAVIQGQKQIILTDKSISYGAGQYLVAGFDVPVIGTVTEASESKPYVCIQLFFDRATLIPIVKQVSKKPSTKLLGIAKTPDSLLASLSRLVGLLKSAPEDAYLVQLYEQEVLYYVLHGPYGHHLKRFALQNDKDGPVLRAIEYLKSTFKEPFDMSALINASARSKSALYRDFKNGTGVSPLQFRTRLRLQEARRLMIIDNQSAAEAGFSVGYDSPSQFNREYSRLYGSPPKEDVAKLRDI